MNDVPAAVVETHISVLFFIGDRVLKLKKPVRFAFADLSTREVRERLCHREVELNRRLAPDVYLGVLDVVDEQGNPVDHLVEMRRLPAERRLAALVERGEDVSTCLRRLAYVLATFHAAATVETGAAGSAERVREEWLDNFDEIERFAGPVLDRAALDRVRSAAGRYIDGRGHLFASRVAEGRTRDGHGDLLAEDIFCLDDGPRVLDCIEFDDRLRYGDVVADVAFLAMDLERLGAQEAADRFLAWYREFSGETHPPSLADHYIAYRALVRSKVACLKHEQGDDAMGAEARRLLELADRRLAHGRVRLVLVGGLPGTGKSTLASGLCDATGWMQLRTDEVRKELSGLPYAEHVREAYDVGLYSDEMTDVTYAELVSRARMLLELGESVVLDASWLRDSHRRAAREAAHAAHADVVELRCELDAGEAARRMRNRRDLERDASDADERIARAMARRMDPWPEATVIPTDSSSATVVQCASAAAAR